MGKIIAIAGNLGAGKTTLAHLLCAQGGFTPYWESPEARPFQRAFSADPPRWALANQLDFFLFRCQQEATARRRDEIAIFDGGLDQDFHVFTRLLFTKGCLPADELTLCQRFYQLARSLLPPPDLVIYLTVDLPSLLARRSARQRETIDHSFDPYEFTKIECLLDEWLSNQLSSPVLRLPGHENYLTEPPKIDALIQHIRARLDLA